MKTEYILIGMLAVLVLAVGACTQVINAPTSDGGHWRCTQVDTTSAKCAEFQDGVAWAQQNCKFNGSVTLCPVFDQQTNQQYQVPVNLINLSAVNRCLKVVAKCTEETYVRNATYEINVTQQ